MYRILRNTFITLIAVLTMGVGSADIIASEHRIIPRPVDYQESKSSFTIKPSTVILIDPTSKELGRIAGLLNEGISVYGLPALKVGSKASGKQSGNTITLIVSNFSEIEHHEGYHLTVEKSGIILKANSANGIFYGVQTILQLMPDKHKKCKPGRIRIAACNILDYPRFPYRGLHLDVGRHMFPVAFIKKYIDMMSMYKFNNFHWHLTEDQGWRLEIKQYPELTETGAYRRSSPVGRNAGDDNVPYGGFYTQDEAREIVAYAAERYVNVIPEIEMPGHATAALATYPHLGCTGGPYEVWTKWGVNEEIFCAGNEDVFRFLENVLLEVMDIFPSKYIHIGGDEAPKTRWDNCDKCRKRIADEGLKDSHELQSYFITRMEKFLNRHGRQIIGWDEILEGGLAPGATVMSWRGIEGGIAAARMGHDVIMTPGSHCYLDYYQGDPSGEPFGIGGYNTLKNTYSYDPVPDVLSAEEGKHILGAQGNLWTEYISKSEMVEYMVYPRAIALAEVNWSPKESKNWESFIARFRRQMPLLDLKNLNYSKSAFAVTISAVTDDKTGQLMVKLFSDLPGADIRYTVDEGQGKMKERKYRRPFRLQSSALIRAYIYNGAKTPDKITERIIKINDATGRQPLLNTMYNHRYAANGPGTLTDGLRANELAFTRGWLGFLGDDADVVIDLGKKTKIEAVSIGLLHNPGNWIFMPVSVDLMTSDDGAGYSPAAGTKPSIITPSEPKSIEYTIININTEARYIRIIARNRGTCPVGHPGEGNKAWLFVDEVMVNPEL